MAEIFAEPGRLGLLVAALALAAWVARGATRRRLAWRALGQAGRPASDGAWPWWFASVGLILTLASPRWGRVAGSELPPGHDVVLVVDVSRSMGAEDAVPDRLGLARAAAQSLVVELAREPGDRAAVVAFAGRAVARCPLTENLDAVLASLDAFRPGSIEPGGTDLGAGLAAALEAFDTEEHAEGRSIVLFSDGEDHADSWPSVVGRLASAEVVVHVVAIGDAEKPSPVPPSNPAANPLPAPALTRRSDAALTQLARATGGAVVPLGVASGDLGALYRDRIAPTTRSHRPAPRFAERAERFGVCLSAALVLGLVGTWPRSRRLRRRGGRGVGSWLRVLVVALVAGSLIFVAFAATPSTPRSRAEAATNRGIEADRAGRFADALMAFDAATAEQPANPIGPFNAGSALFALGRYPEAIVRYDRARTLADGRLRVKVDYALGNSSALAGDLAGAIGHYDACLQAPEPGPDLDAVRRDAAINRAFARDRITPPPDAPSDGGDRNGGEPNDKPPPGSDRNQPRSRAKSGSDPDSPPNPSGDPGASGTRGAGGAGGSGAAPPEAGSPAGQLDAALRRIKAAKERHPDEPPPPPSPGPRASGKDW